MSANNCGNNIANQHAGEFKLPDLPYEINALEPAMSQNTLEFHHGKHHQTYVTNLNKLVSGSEFSNMTLEEIIIASSKDSAKQGVFNNAAQIWNHSFFWHCLTPNGGGNPVGELVNQINKDFGSFENFREQFANAGATQFGSGWAWLTFDGNKLEICKTSNADLPLTQEKHAIITCDVWEHAYYLDFQNMRPAYLANFLDNLVNWKFAEENFQAAKTVCAA